MNSIEDILRAKAMQDGEFRKGTSDFALAVGGGTGSILGVMAGKGVKGRMAGGLIGAMLGGGLGKGLQASLVQESPAARLLAKMQVQGSLNTTEKAQLQSLVEDAYAQQLG